MLSLRTRGARQGQPARVPPTRRGREWRGRPHGAFFRSTFGAKAVMRSISGAIVIGISNHQRDSRAETSEMGGADRRAVDLASDGGAVLDAYPDRVTSCLKSGSARAWPQPSHDHVVRRSAAARQAVPWDRGFCKCPCLRAELSFLARKCHPLANNGASYLRLGHLDTLSRSRRKRCQVGGPVLCSYSDHLTVRYAAFWTG